MERLAKGGKIAAGEGQIQGDQGNGEQDDGQIAFQLGIPGDQPEFAADQEKIDGKIHAEEDHGHRRDALDIGRVACQAVVAHGKTAGAR